MFTDIEAVSNRRWFVAKRHGEWHVGIKGADGTGFAVCEPALSWRWALFVAQVGAWLDAAGRPERAVSD